MRKGKIKNNNISTYQKKRFFKFALNVYTGKINGDNGWHDLKDFGFCNMYRYFFEINLNLNVGDFELLPELLEYKPKIFYDCSGEMADEDNQFWFRPSQNDERIEICKKILIELSNLKTICPDCGGSGEITTSHEFKHCKMCNGSGKVKLKL